MEVRAVAPQLVWRTLSIQKLRTLLFSRTLKRRALVAFAEGAFSPSSIAVIVAADCSQVGAYRCLLNRWPEKSLPRPRRAVGQDACASTASLKKDICSAESWSERLFTGFSVSTISLHPSLRNGRRVGQSIVAAKKSSVEAFRSPTNAGRLATPSSVSA